MREAISSKAELSEAKLSQFGVSKLGATQLRAAEIRAVPPRTLRLNRALAEAGLSSRRGAEQLIRSGQVCVNGAVVRSLSTVLSAGVDRLEVNGDRVAVPARTHSEVWALYKPRNCMSTLHDPQGRLTLAALLPFSPKRLFPVGRLDWNAEGLILLTNDGKLAHRILHPSFRVPKVYWVKVRGEVSPRALEAIRRGVWLEAGRRSHAQGFVLHSRNGKTWLELTLREGVQHHLHKIFNAVGHSVLKIKRYQVGPIALEDLRPGESRLLDTDALWRLWKTIHENAESVSSAAKQAVRRKAPRDRVQRRQPQRRQRASVSGTAQPVQRIQNMKRGTL